MLLNTLKLSLHSFSLKIKLIIRNPKAIIDWSIGVEYNNISDIVLGEGVRIHKGTVLTARNNSSREQGLLKIGRNTYIGENNIIRASGGVKIGDNCLISNNVVIVSENHGTKLGIPITKQSSATKKGVTICDDVWIGANVVILPGVVVGSGAVVGAGSVVVRSVPENAIVMGNPATVKKMRS